MPAGLPSTWFNAGWITSYLIEYRQDYLCYLVGFLLDLDYLCYLVECLLDYLCYLVECRPHYGTVYLVEYQLDYLLPG